MQINNSYSLREISEITGGRCYGNIDVKIKNIHFDSRRIVKDNDHLFIAFKHNIFVSNYTKRIKENIRIVKKLPKVKGVTEILYPGQNKMKRYKLNMKKDIKISKSISDEINNL